MISFGRLLGDGINADLLFKTANESIKSHEGTVIPHRLSQMDVKVSSFPYRPDIEN